MVSVFVEFSPIDLDTEVEGLAAPDDQLVDLMHVLIRVVGFLIGRLMQHHLKLHRACITQ